MTLLNDMNDWCHSWRKTTTRSWLCGWTCPSHKSWIHFSMKTSFKKRLSYLFKGINSPISERRCRGISNLFFWWFKLYIYRMREIQMGMYMLINAWTKHYLKALIYCNENHKKRTCVYGFTRFLFELTPSLIWITLFFFFL